MLPDRPLHRRTRALAAALLALGAAACSDRANPVGPGPGTGTPPGTPGTPITIQALECTGNRQTLAVSCAAALPAGSTQGDIIVGNQGVLVKLTSSNVAYNSGTGQFTFDVTVQNLIQQPMGTTDGTTTDPNGVRVFFSSGPTVTGGTGTAAVVPDGFATFTAAGQPFYQYNQLLAQNATSGAKTWTLVMPPTVTSFTFLLYVSAPVEYPNGYITLDGELPDYHYGPLHPTATHPLTAVSRTAVGNVVPGTTITFGTTNAACATVSGTGLVDGVQFATCSITANDGTRSGSMVFDVTGMTRAWTGATSADWSVGTNWADGLVPVAADSVTVPFPLASGNFPVLTSAVAISDLTVADQATLNVASFVLTSTGNVRTGQTAPSGIVASGAGSVLLSGANKAFQGRFPSVLVTGTYALDGQYHGVAPQAVDSGTITSDLFEMDVDAQ
ncbi:hypothetical protein [Longimicrobium sp.]|uniref:hypothetical protein n=1 Tax=Longimicrobium sp. TaxID=2029185 RepID=UPI002C5F4D69|nr:hypothetical protein [Longimicrobium sp.]HSU17328.1 hypothetical protein [Longimicrobium sp.]